MIDLNRQCDYNLEQKSRLSRTETFMKKILLVMSFVCISQAYSQAPPPDYTPYNPNYPALSPQEIMEFARRGAEFLENGGDIQEFNKNPGMFTHGDFLDFRYLVVFDCETKTVLAHPFLPKVVGVPGLLHTMKDARGRATSVELCEMALTNPKGGWIVAFVPKPGEGTIDLVYKYILRVKNTNWAVGVNARNLRIESHLDKRAREEEELLNSLVQ
jgi:hypothetical protein